jgi:predicted O-linked N-acetylglucosamine transferase (SPINDLY family)
MPAADELFAQGLRHFHEGRWPQAQQLLQAVLAATPGHFPSLHLLGLIAMQTNQAPAAAECFRRAGALQPDNPDLHSLLGTALHALGRFDEAVACHRRALAIAPRHGMALNNLGISLVSRGEVDEAIDVFRKAREIQPDDPGTLTNLAAALRTRDRSDEAADLFREAIRRSPNLPQAHNNLGNIYQDQGRFDEAEASYREAIRLAPRFAMAHGNLGNMLAMRGRNPEAVQAYRAALAAGADATVAGRLANVLLQLNRRPEALTVCREAIRRKPDDPELLNNLGNACSAGGQLDEAVAAYRRALAVKPGWSVPQYNLGLALRNQGRPAESRAALRAALELAPDDAVNHSTYVGSFHYDPDADAATLLAEHRRWAERHTARLPPPEKYANVPDPERRLRVGYVSPDFRSHASSFFLEPLLAHHDPDRVETFCYAEVTAPDAVTARFRGRARHWLDTPGMTDDELAARVRADGIDVLVDLCGHMAYNRLLTFARRPAPVQISYLGYPGTTGLPAIPYRIADAVTAGPGEPVAPGEELVVLPGVFCCYSPPRPVPIDAPPPSRRAGVVTFGSLHKLDKLNDRVLDLWCRLLREAPTARLLLCRNTLHGPTADYWREQFTRRGVPAERLLLESVENVDMRHLEVYNRIDVSLDVFPWSGHTTACEALWMGVPVVTLRGDRYAGRMTASVLTAVGLGDWVAETADGYVRIALQLAADEGLRARLRTDLRPKLLGSPLCDGPGFARGLEEVYRDLWRRWCAAQAPAADR